MTRHWKLAIYNKVRDSQLGLVRNRPLVHVIQGLEDGVRLYISYISTQVYVQSFLGLPAAQP